MSLMEEMNRQLREHRIRGEVFVGGRWKIPSRPFGFIMPNGMNFSKSIHDPNSVLRRVLKVVDESPVPLSKREILTKLGYRLDLLQRNQYIGTYRIHVARGFLSWYFSAFHKAGFLSPVRRGRGVVWTKGVNFPKMEKLINV